MNFLKYVSDKRFFIFIYIAIMLFVSTIIMVGVNGQNMLNNILYLNITCFVFASLYITIGYFYRRKFYRELIDTIESGQEDFAVLMPLSQNHQHRIFLQLLKKIHHDNRKQLQVLHDDKRDQQEFILSWIHEVKLPIAASRLLMENSENKTTDFLIDKFEDELNKIDNYVEQALYYSRIDTFSKDYFINEINVNQVIKNSIKKYSKLFINKEIKFHMEDKDQLVQSDSKWLDFVFDQIIANALKYTNNGGNLSVLFEENSKEKRIVILDDGIGIKSEDIHRLFEKGFTGTTGRSDAKSTGIGLYLAKQLALKLGHDISIDSEEGKYTKVTVHFPKIRSYFQLENQYKSYLQNK
ncbi:HAMP domain-containing sensor histidine kinase [Bacillus sp. FJAT-22090]|uniref:sensor histidine kinase n=1 Tax=Bacillus sp. FJAT-22090 TaxID=1581038 RepID=UPI00119FC879|nr:sensor histidine kinase [Bacillus sp. FJAT-22090]